jgi:endonuclease/exonuclease/phosphatase (EEP) superfamily protein YafD
MKPRIKDFSRRYAVALGWVYFTLLFGWLFLYLIFGSRGGYLDIVSNLAVYLFFPLPVIALLGLFTRRRDLIGGTIIGVIAFLWFWGALFTPDFGSLTRKNPQPKLTVITYNVLGMHEYVDPVIAVIRSEDPDVVFLQEVNPTMAVALQNELANEYPFQILDPRDTVHGMGTLSRYPLNEADIELPPAWIGVPQILDLDLDGTPVKLVNFHSHPYAFRNREIYQTFQELRQQQAYELLAFATLTEEPLIIAGDANDTSLSRTYQTITSGALQDVWREAGFGLGHTFPGSDIPGSARWKIGDWSIPQWLTRIDYIFVSPHWEVVSARMAQFDGVSDHRGVVAELAIE